MESPCYRVFTPFAPSTRPTSVLHRAGALPSPTGPGRCVGRDWSDGLMACRFRIHSCHAHVRIAMSIQNPNVEHLLALGSRTPFKAYLWATYAVELGLAPYLILRSNICTVSQTPS